MQIQTLITIAFLVLSTSAQFVGPKGKRTCFGGAISFYCKSLTSSVSKICQYGKHRCANICGDTVTLENGNAPAFLDPLCSCPETHEGAAYTGAACIDVIRALARYGC
ncbi:hypothetical protein ONS95_007582 [Cadophora gregata]|uniref:uncharacterized protein n=1 Tax=Cadophora gregata TaxID=51156 RepID=UPI0026DC400F|nr:uncharacterized protein ONS95_007582 [Cadophora gregata]KAK0118697.1 hypothetical protein ONS96_011785 [Cadophora gregata f. sp. sojae]KAK0125959.1 hypothetical protein ONS95_007582 [Cadophora gregata]